MLKKSILTAVYCLLAVTAVFASDEEAIKLFNEGTSLIGGRILSDLAKKCDEIDDEIIGRHSGHEAKVEIMRCLNGQIGPISYVHISEKGKKDSAEVDSEFGKTWKGPSYMGPKIAPRKGKYVVESSPKFDEGLKKWNQAARMKCFPACGELAAIVFTDAYKGSNLGLNEQKMYGYFSFAAADGSADAAFMCAVCEFYGIGTTRSRKAAFESLDRWKALSGTRKARRGGWIANRFADRERLDKKGKKAK